MRTENKISPSKEHQTECRFRNLPSREQAMLLNWRLAQHLKRRHKKVKNER